MRAIEERSSPSISRPAPGRWMLMRWLPGSGSRRAVRTRRPGSCALAPRMCVGSGLTLISYWYSDAIRPPPCSARLARAILSEDRLVLRDIAVLIDRELRHDANQLVGCRTQADEPPEVHVVKAGG